MITGDEVHAFVIGLCEVVCPWRAWLAMPIEYVSPLKGEYHYYLAGRGVGFITLLLLGVGIAKLAEEVL